MNTDCKFLQRSCLFNFLLIICFWSFNGITVVNAETVNLIPNPSVEISPLNATAPTGWNTNDWGKGKQVFTYLKTDGQDGSRSLRVQVLKNRTGDVKWYFTPVTTIPNTNYYYSNYYKSSAPTETIVQFENKKGKLSFIHLGVNPPSSTWKKSEFTFTTSANAKRLTVFQMIDSVGYLQTDDFVLNQVQQNTVSTPQFISKWGDTGSTDEILSDPEGIAVDKEGNIIIVDTGSNRVKKYTSDGSYILKWGNDYLGHDGCVDRLSTPDIFNKPESIAINSSNIVYISEPNYGRLQSFSSIGEFINLYGGGDCGSGQGRNTRLRGIGFNTQNILFSTQHGDVQDSWIINALTGQIYAQLDRFTNFNGNTPPPTPNALAFDKNDIMYVVDGRNFIQKFNANGTFIKKWGGMGSVDGQFTNPTGIAIDSAGLLYVVDSGNNRVEVFDSEGNFKTKFGSVGSGDGQFSDPKSIAIDADDNIYVTDTGNNRIEKFTK